MGIGERQGVSVAPVTWNGNGARMGRRLQIAMLREIVGDPFTPVAFSPKWRTEQVAQLAEAIAIDGLFEDLPILADALEDAGCDEHSVLWHLRSAGPHFLGCWALDLVRGKR